MLVEGIEQNCPIPDQYDVFKAMRKVPKNLLLGDEKYRTLYADNDMVQKKILGRVGGYELLRGLGFKQGLDDNELVAIQIDQQVINLAINSLKKRIFALKERGKIGEIKVEHHSKRMQLVVINRMKNRDSWRKH